MLNETQSHGLKESRIEKDRQKKKGGWVGRHIKNISWYYYTFTKVAKILGNKWMNNGENVEKLEHLYNINRSIH